MMPSSASSKKKKEGLDSDSEESNSVSSGHENGKQPRTRWSDTSRTTNEPSSASTTVSTTVGTRHPTAQSVTLPSFPAVAAAAPAVPRSEKKPSRAGFRGGFLQMLRVMLDRESQNDSSTIQWSADGNSFIVTDQTQFEEHTIPTYFDKQIVFASFLRKLYRWGFKRVSSNRFGHYEFGSPTFKRLDAGSAPAAAAAAAAADTSSNGGGASIQVQHQPAQAFSSSLQQVMAQTNRLPASNPLPASQADANAIMALLSNIQCQLSSQQPSIPSQQSVLNQSTNNPLNMIHILQSFQQRQHPNPTLNLLNTALSIFIGGQAPSLSPLMGYSSSSSQSNAVHVLMSLYGMTLLQLTLPNTITSAPMFQLLVLAMQRVVEEEVQRRAQADAVNHAIISTIGQFAGRNIMIDEAQRQRGLAAALGQTHGSTGATTTPGMTLRVPYSSVAQSQQVGAPPPSAGHRNIQADSNAAILQAARRGDVAGQHEDDDHARNDPDDSVNEGNKNDDHEGRPLSPRKRKSPDDDQHDADYDDSWTKRLRPRKKSPRK